MLETKRAIQVYQNTHLTVVNPDPARPPASQFTEAVKFSDAAPAVSEGDDRSFGAAGRVERRFWALSRDAGLITTPKLSGGTLYFRNNTHDRLAALETHRSPAAGSWQAKEFFFLAASDQPAGGGFLRGALYTGFEVAVPDYPVPTSGISGHSLVEGTPPGSPAARATFVLSERANVLLPLEGPRLAFRKFNYSSNDGDFEAVAAAVSAACQTYLRAGFTEAEVLDSVALPAMRAASAAGRPFGYSSVAGTVPVPLAAIEAAEDGALRVPVLMNISYDEDQELFSSLFCAVTAVDPTALGAAERAGADYPLIVSAVVEGLEEGEESEGEDDAGDFLEDYKALVAATDAKANRVNGPGEDEEVAQEIARGVLEDGADLFWTQFSADCFVRGVKKRAGEREGRIAARVQEIILTAAAIRAVRPGDPATAYEGYLAWFAGAGAPG